MSREDRAKQFMPFAALKGYENALREKEKIVVPKIELSEDMKEELDVTLKEVQLKDIVTVVYYDTDEYIKITGMVSKIDTSAGYIKIVNTKINFNDVFDIIR
ncbi:MAG: YolD-like family protein [Lachnospiraceae bacterium]|nr:YolD-like family protein [Lachnospiraceae bacterium]